MAAEIIASIALAATALLTVLVVGLLRAHGEILKEIHGGHEHLQSGHLPHEPAPPTGLDLAPNIMGESLEGHHLEVVVPLSDRPTLVAFLSSGCMTCARFWDAFRAGYHDELPDKPDIVVVVKDRVNESVGRLAKLAPPREAVPLIFSSAAFEEYRVPVSPYFVLVSGKDARVQGEGVSETWANLTSLLANAAEDVSFLESGSETVSQAT